MTRPNPITEKPGFALPIALLVICICFAAGCDPKAPPGDLTDSEKRSTIESMYSEYKPSFPDVTDISVDALLAIDREDLVIVDVREPNELEVSMIPGALSKSDFEARLEEFDGKTIVVHCTIGYRSGLYVAELNKKGIDAVNLKGSVLSWAHAGQSFVTPDGETTKRVHVYGPDWDLLPADYEAVW